jgi:hypothetical protein
MQQLRIPPNVPLGEVQCILTITEFLSISTMTSSIADPSSSILYFVPFSFWIRDRSLF